MKIVLKPYWIAEECFLREALMWAGFNRFPLSEIIPDQIDYRFDKDTQDDYSPNIPNDSGYIESEEAVRVGLPPNPEWEELIKDINQDPTKDEYLLSVESINKFLKSDFPDDIKNKYREQLPLAEKRDAIQAEWNKKYEEYIELYKSKIFIAMREGKLGAKGRIVPKEEDQAECWDFGEHEPIPANYWRQDGINWGESSSKNDKAEYCHICVNTEQLFSIFPLPPASSPPKAIQLIADQYVLDDADLSKVIPKGKRGRPSHKWDDLYIEVIARIQGGKLPDKQESFIAEMQEWCLKNWGVEIGRTTLLEKISPVYKRFGRRKSENCNRKN